MIVVNGKETSMEQHKSETMSVADIEKDSSMEDMFRKELDAYCTYKEWADDTDDDVLEMALEEIMFDEYLHAKFLRDYMIDKGWYKLTDVDPHEKRFQKIHKHMFED
jgi:hypothetical protein